MFKVHSREIYFRNRRSKISKHFMFKVHYVNLSSIKEFTSISKHFMFKVHKFKKFWNATYLVFQNISCLRFIDE